MHTTTSRSPRQTARSHWLATVLVCLAGGLLVLGLSYPASAGGMSAEVQTALDTSTYVYIQSERKSGDFGSKAEIWFLHHDGAVWVGTPATTYRVKRIQAGRAKAKIWVGSRDGPVFDAVGSLEQDEDVLQLMYRTFAEKYPDGWLTYEDGFRSGFADGSRVLVRYAPASAE